MTKDDTSEKVMKKPVEEQNLENSDNVVIKSAEKVHNAEKRPDDYDYISE